MVLTDIQKQIEICRIPMSLVLEMVITAMIGADLRMEVLQLDQKGNPILSEAPRAPRAPHNLTTLQYLEVLMFRHHNTYFIIL
jgi:hypothetical protein